MGLFLAVAASGLKLMGLVDWEWSTIWGAWLVAEGTCLALLVLLKEFK